MERRNELGADTLVAAPDYGDSLRCSQVDRANKESFIENSGKACWRVKFRFNFFTDFAHGLVQQQRLVGAPAGPGRLAQGIDRQ
jgi:hypothetical protein